MAIDFPNTPTLNQVFTASNRSWKYDGEKWVGISSDVYLYGSVRDNIIRAYMEVI